MKSIKKLMLSIMMVFSLCLSLGIVRSEAATEAKRLYFVGNPVKITGYVRATSSNAAVLGVSVSGSTVTVTPKKEGTATVSLYRTKKGPVNAKYVVKAVNSSRISCSVSEIKTNAGKTVSVGSRVKIDSSVGATYKLISHSDGVFITGANVQFVMTGNATVLAQIVYQGYVAKTYKIPVHVAKACITGYRASVSSSWKYVGEGFSKSEITLKGVYSDGTVDVIPDFTYSFPKTTKAGTYKLTVTAPDGTKVTLNITVKDRPTVTNTVVTCKKSSVPKWYVFSSSDFTAYQTLSDGTKKTLSLKDIDAVYSGTTAKVKVTTSSGAVRTVTVPATAVSPKLPSGVKSSDVVGVSFVLARDWVRAGSDIPKDMILAWVTYKYGSSSRQTLVSAVPTDFTAKSATGTYEVTANYLGRSQKFTITVKPANVKLVSLVSDSYYPRKPYTYFGEEPLSCDYKITGKYSDGSVGDVVESMITSWDKPDSAGDVCKVLFRVNGVGTGGNFFLYQQYK